MKQMMLCLLLLLFLCLPAQAGEEEILAEGLPEEAAEVMEGIVPSEKTNFWSSAKTVLGKALRGSQSSVREGMKLCGTMLAIVLLCGLVQANAPENMAIAVVGALGICACLMGSFFAMVDLAKSTVADLTDYSACMLPVMASSLAMSGAPASASALYGGTVLFSQLWMQLISKLLVPAVYFYVAMATAEAAVGSDMLSELREFIAWLITKCLRIVLYIFTAYMSLTGVISGSADALTVKATKAAISGMIPVVGGIVSDASESLLAGAAVLKNTAGIFGMLAILAIVLLPFLRVGIQYLLMKLTAALSAAVGCKPHVQLLKNLSGAMGMLLGMCGACGLMMLVSCICFLKVVI